MSVPDRYFTEFQIFEQVEEPLRLRARELSAVALLLFAIGTVVIAIGLVVATTGPMPPPYEPSITSLFCEGIYVPV